MKIYKLFFIFFFLVVITSCKEKKSFENEPNNSFSQANFIQLDSEVRGFINTKNDKDYFRLVDVENAILDIRLSGIKGVNHSIKIWEGDNPVLIKTIDDNRKSSPERIVNIYAKGKYYITVQHGERDRKKINLETPYILSITGRDPVNEELEPNDKLINSTEISIGEEVIGFFSPSYNRLNYDKEHPFREEDWFKITIGPELNPPLLANITLSEVHKVNSILTFYNSNFNIITSSNNNGTGLSEEIKDIGITNPGNYYIMVTTKGYGYNNEDPYYLNISFNEFDTAFEMEPNNDIVNANQIIENEIFGRINSSEDRDYFLFRVPEKNGIYRVEAVPPLNLDIKFNIYNIDNEKILEINNSKKGKREIFPNFNISSDFYIAVSAKYTGFNQDDKYRLSVNKIEDVNISEIEPNDNKSEANRIKNEITGFISQKGDKDYYLIEYDRITKLRIEISGVKGGKIAVSVTDPLGFIIKTVEVAELKKTFSEMIDKKGYLIVESIAENYDNPYKILIKDGE